MNAAWLKEWLDYVTGKTMAPPGPSKGKLSQIMVSNLFLVSNLSLTSFDKGILSSKPHLQVQTDCGGDFR